MRQKAHESAAEPFADPSTEAEPSPSGRDHKGRFAPGNRGHLIHGRYSRAVAEALTVEQRDLLATLAQHESAILGDLGGESELSTFERDLVRRYMQLDNVAMFNAPRMLASRASARREARDTFMMCADRMLKIIGLLGARRRQKNIGELSIEEYAALQPHDAHDAHGDQ